MPPGPTLENGGGSTSGSGGSDLTSDQESELRRRGAAGDSLVSGPASIDDGTVTAPEPRPDPIVSGPASIDDGTITAPETDDGRTFGSGASVPGTGGTVQIGDDGTTVTHTPTGETRNTGGGGGGGGGSGGSGGGGGPLFPDVNVNFPELDFPAGPDLDLAGPAAIVGVFLVVAVGVYALASNIPSAVAGEVSGP